MLSEKIDSLLVLIFIVSMTIIGLGLVMVASSSMAFSDHGYDARFYHTSSHLVRIMVGTALAVLVYISGLGVLRRFSPVLLVMSVLLGLLVFVPALSVNVNGAARWLRLGGLVFQPYDVIKLGFIVYFAYALARFQTGEKHELKVAALFTAVVGVLLLLQPDFGSFFLLFSVLLVTIFMVFGLSRYYVAFIALGTIVVVYLILSEPYRMERILTLLNPWADRYGSGFQLIQALIAEGSGGISGVGMGQSVQKMLYLPEAHTDFTISVFAEEAGLLGVMIVLSLVVYLYISLMKLSLLLRSHEYFYEGYIVFIVASFIIVQSLFNIGVNYGLLPTKGITLPFMGYGGTSIVSHIIMLGMVLSVRRDKRMSSSVPVSVPRHNVVAMR